MNATIILANDLLDGPAESLSTTLEIFTYGYTAVRPCMTALNARTRTISETVMLLPDALQQNMVILNATQSKLDAVLQIDSAGGGPNMSQRLNQVLNDAAGQMQATEQAALQVSDARQQLTGTVQFDVLVASLNAVRGSMANAQGDSRFLPFFLSLITVANLINYFYSYIDFFIELDDCLCEWQPSGVALPPPREPSASCRHHRRHIRQRAATMARCC